MRSGVGSFCTMVKIPTLWQVVVVYFVHGCKIQLENIRYNLELIKS